MGGAAAWLAFVPWLLLGVVGLGGLVALARLAEGQVGGRQDRRPALQLAGALAVLIWLGFVVLIGGAGNPVGGLALLPAALALGSVAGASTFLAAILGYVLFARIRPLGAAFAAEAGVPLALGLAVLAALNWSGDARNAYANWLHVSVAVVEPGTIVGAAVSGTIRLQVTVRTDEGYLISQPSTGRRYPVFRIAAERDMTPVPCGIEVNAPPGGPATYEAGHEYRYDVAFVVPTGADPSCRFAAGPWWLDFLLGGSRVETPNVPAPWIQQVRFELGATPPRGS